MTQIYYPSLVVNTVVRFESFLSLDPNSYPQPESTTDLPNAPTGLGVNRAKSVLFEPSADRNSITTSLVPEQWSMEWPSHRQAGKWSITLPFSKFPIDPRTIADMACEFYLGAIPADQFSRGMTAQKGPYASILAASEDNLVMVGTSDDIDLDFDAHTVTISGRDMRAILIDSPADSKFTATLDYGATLPNLIRQVLNRHPFGANFRIAAFAQEWPDGFPTLAGKDRDRALRGSSKDGKGTFTPKTSAGQGDTSYWDVISYLCYQANAIPLFVGREILIRPARTFLDLRQRGGIDPSVPTPFANGKRRKVTVVGAAGVPVTEEIAIRRFVQGLNLSGLKLNKKVRGDRTKVIEVRSLHHSANGKGDEKMIRARWPERADLARIPFAQNADPALAATTNVAPSGKKAVADVTPIYVGGLASAAEAKEIARQVWEEISRGEIEGSFETTALASLGGTNNDPDLLRLRVGDPIEILQAATPSGGTVSLSPVVSQNARFRGLSFEQLVAEYQKQLGIGAAQAKVMAATAQNAISQVSQYFRVKGWKINGSGSGPCKISIDFHNYLEPRRQVSEPPASNRQPTAPTKEIF